MEKEEYNRDTNPYPSSGKKYNGECAVISLTSWKARINTVSKTLFSLIKQCPGFHIVLVLSEEEFPQKEKELPENLMVFVENELIELLWVYKNYKSFKKVLFTMDKYRDVPVISADDDCIYTCNYAQILYDDWFKNKECIVTPGKHIMKTFQICRGCATLYRPYCFLDYAIKNFVNMPDFNNDDAYISAINKKLSIKIYPSNYSAEKDFLIFHDCKSPLSLTTNTNWTEDMQKYFNCLK